MTKLNDIIETLSTLGTKERSKKSETMYPTSMRVIGVMNPDLRTVMKELYGIMKNEPRQSFIALSEELVATGIIECQMLAWLLLEKADLVKTINKSELNSLEGVLDNWVSVDTYGTIIYGVLWRMGIISDKDVFSLSQNQDVWYRRLALVATVALNLRARGGKGDVIRTLTVCKMAVDDHHDMVVKALSWALRSLIVWDKSAVSDFLIENNTRIHKRVIREVKHKLDYGTKN